jgi:protein-arginine kinase activator protein McsA
MEVPGSDVIPAHNPDRGYLGANSGEAPWPGPATPWPGQEGVDWLGETSCLLTGESTPLHAGAQHQQQQQQDNDGTGVLTTHVPCGGAHTVAGDHCTVGEARRCPFCRSWLSRFKAQLVCGTCRHCMVQSISSCFALLHGSQSEHLQRSEQLFGQACRTKGKLCHTSYRSKLFTIVHIQSYS